MPFRTLASFVAVFAAASALLSAPATVHAATASSEGIYTDGDGKKHAWSVNGAHTLIWDGKPFIPVGGSFQAKSWTPGATDADFESDCAALDAIKAKGVTDIYVQPARGGITGVKPANIQRLIDYLEKQGFTYGVSLNDGPREPLIAHIIRPGAFRHIAPEDGGDLRFAISDLGSALYFLVSQTNSETLGTGDAQITGDGARVTVAPRAGQNVVFLVPERIYFSGGAMGIPNLWEGFDGYRDSLIALWGKVKLGRGFRFFVDPLPSSLAWTEEWERAVPSSREFAGEWATWLTRKYRTVDALQTSWSITERGVKTFDEAARLLPLWNGGKGIEAFYAKKTGVQHRANSRSSAFWGDLNAFKLDTVKGYMNDLATLLKREVADAPVVYRTHGYSPLFANLPAGRGFDGFGIDAYGRGDELALQTASYIYAQAADAPKTIWLPVTATSDKATGKPAKGYASRVAMHSDLDWLRDIGARGFFVNGVRVADAARANNDLSDAPEQLGWLADYAHTLDVAGLFTSPNAPSAAPPVAVFYPRSIGFLTPRPLMGGGWWLPTDRPATYYNFGASGQAYGMSEPDGTPIYYLWKPDGPPRPVRLKIPKQASLPNAPRLAWSANANGEVKKGVLTITVGPDPVRLINFPGLPIPLDAFDESAKEAKKLIAEARKRNMMNASLSDQTVQILIKQYREESPWTTLGQLQSEIDKLRSLLRPYFWIEAESAQSTTFDEAPFTPGASGGRVLATSERLAGHDLPTASYGISVGDPGVYQIWVAASPRADLSFRLDGQPLLDDAASPTPTGSPYANNGLIWFRLGTATLSQGVHTIEMQTASAATSVDAILMTRSPFTPNGSTPPPILP